MTGDSGGKEAGLVVGNPNPAAASSIIAHVVHTPEHISAHVPGIVGYMRFMMQNNEGWQGIFNLDKVQTRLQKSETSKRTDIKRTLISFPRQDTFGYRLERKEDYITPLPCNGNNFYKNHS